MNRLELSLVLVFTVVLLLPAATALQCVIGVSVQVGNSLIPIGGAVTPCNGECSNTTIYRTIVIYACDPIALCKQFNLSNRCDIEAQNISGCCCDTGDNCNFPGVPPTLAPGVTLPPPIQCFAGIATAGSTLGIGASLDCVGDCANVTLGNATVFLCDPISVCQTLNLIDQCQTLENFGGPNNVGGCCCSTPNCNFPNRFASTTPTLPTTTQMTTTTTRSSSAGLQCYIGVSVKLGTGPIPIGGAVTPCNGECSNTTIYNTIVIYACDPISVCKQFNLSNSCDIEAQNIVGCCCDTADNCNFPGVPPTLAPGVTLPPPTQCFAGIALAGSALGIGASLDCVGDCANVTLGDTTVFLCDPISVCQNLNIYNRCQTLEDFGGPNNVGGCCCSTPNCNFPNPFASTTPALPTTTQMTTTNTQTPRPGLQCYIGVSVQVGTGPIPIGGAVTPCNGECSNTTIFGTIVIYACDPISVCKQFNLSNSCDIEAQNIVGCCCDTADNCNFPGVPPTLAPGVTLPPPMQCFAGIATAGSTLGIGASLDCVGDCANVTLGDTTVFLCDPISVCQTLDLIDKCRTLEDFGGPNNVGGCCCSTDYCNFPNRFANTTPTTSTATTTVSALPDQCPLNNHYETVGELASPGFPSLYGNNLNCYYHLTARSGSRVVMLFQHFRTEQCCDVVTLYDGNSTQSKIIARLSGQLTIPTAEYRTSIGNNQMLMIFVTDATDVYQGWLTIFFSDDSAI